MILLCPKHILDTSNSIESSLLIRATYKCISTAPTHTQKKDFFVSSVTGNNNKNNDCLWMFKTA